MKIYAISGLGADQRVFQFLKLDHELIPLDWITPLANEDIQAYAKRLSQSIDTSVPFRLIGVSFGGLVATEIHKVLKPELTILISSVETRNELPSLYRWLGKINLTPMIPQAFFQAPLFLMHWLFGTKQKRLLGEILNDTDLNFTKWAIGALLTWNNTIQSKRVLRIHGTVDKLIPLKFSGKVDIVQDGGHLMIVDKADEVSSLINNHLKSVTLNKKQ